MKKLLVFAVLSVSTWAIPGLTQQVTLTSADTSCTTSSNCTLQVYKASGACPASGIGSLTYTEVAPTLAGTASVSGTTWSYADTAVTTGSTYCYYVTATYTAGTFGPSPPSPTFQGILAGIQYVAGSYQDSGIKVGTASLGITCAGGEFVSIIAHDSYHGAASFISVKASGNVVMNDNNLFTGWSGTTPYAGGAVGFFSISSCAAGKTTLTVKSSSIYGSPEIFVARYTGLVSKTRDVAATWASSTSGSKTASCVITPTTPGELLVGLVGTFTTPYMTVSGLTPGWNLRGPSSTNGDGGTVVDNLASASGSNPLSLTLSTSTPWECGIVAYK